jgi:hypothetical protein
MDVPQYMVMNPLFVEGLKKTTTMRRYSATIEKLRHILLKTNP